MDNKSSTFMLLGTTFGMVIAFIISLVLVFFVQDYTTWIPFIFLGFAIFFRCIGYLIDRFIDKRGS